MRARWGTVFLVIFLILILAYNRRIAEALRPLRIGELWTDFCNQLWAAPAPGRYVLVALVLMLLYLTAYFLVREWIRRK
jgi:hypothetical protein